MCWTNWGFRTGAPPRFVGRCARRARSPRRGSCWSSRVDDYFHVVERLGAISRPSLQHGDEAQRAWLRVLERFLKAGDIEAIERSLATPPYEELVINLRLKGSIVFWTEELAEGILHLRAYAKSGRWAELESAVLANTGWRPTARLVRIA